MSLELVLFLFFVFNVDDPESLCVCVRLSVCLSLAIDSLETAEVIIVKLGSVTASDI